MEMMFGLSDFGGEKVVGLIYFLPWPTIFQLPQIREKMGRESDLIKMTFIPLLLNVNTFFLPFFYFIFFLFFLYCIIIIINFFPFYGFFVWRWTLLLFSFCLKSFFIWLCLWFRWTFFFLGSLLLTFT